MRIIIATALIFFSFSVDAKGFFAPADSISNNLDTEEVDMSVLLDIEDAQEETPGNRDEEIFIIVDKYPVYPGGNEALLKEVAQKLRYPVEAMENEIQGKVYLKFVIDENGEVGDIQIAKDIGGGCGEAAVQAVRFLSHKFTPGIEDGKAVKVYFTLPVKFTLLDDTSVNPSKKKRRGMFEHAY